MLLTMTQSIFEFCTIHIKMTSTPTETNIASTEPPPAKKQKLLEIGFKGIVENVQRILECLVCFNIPENTDKVQFCPNGHMLCDTCHQRILDKKCPTCQSEDWNSHHILKPLINQILSALPKPCPFQECEIQLEDKDRLEHMKNCRFRLVDCINISKCSLRLPFNTFTNHMKEVHAAYLTKNTDGNFNKKLSVKESDLGEKARRRWHRTMTEFDNQTFFVLCYKEGGLFGIQIFLHGNITTAEKYVCRIEVTNDDPRYKISFFGDIISVDVPIAEKGRDNHSGTFSFTSSMARRLLRKGENGQILSLDLTIIKKE